MLLLTNRTELPSKKLFSSDTLPNERVPDKQSFSVCGWLLLLQGLWRDSGVDDELGLEIRS